MSQQVFFRDSDGIIGAGTLVDGKPVRVTFTAEQRSAELVASFRSTTSSRKPGAAIEGTVWRRKRQLIACSKCHRLRVDLGGPHAPQAHPDGSVTDCMGDVVVPARAEAA